MRRVLITGSRHLKEPQPVHDALWAQARLAGGLDKLIVVHGCARGADEQAGTFCIAHEVIEERHPAQWEKYGKAAGAIRNGRMVDLGADVCLAFPRDGSRGTYDCMTRAKKAGIPVVVG